MAELFIYPKKSGMFSFPLQKEKISFGRSAENVVSISDPFCSGHHAYMDFSNDQYYIRDNNSKNGTFLNGKKVQSAGPLQKGDEILIGSTRIIFDRELETNVEMTEAPSSSLNINTIMHLEEILREPDLYTTIHSPEKPHHLKDIEQENKQVGIINEVSRALLLHKPLNELLEHIMDLICENMHMDRGILMRMEGNPPQPIPKVVRIVNEQLADQKILVCKSIIMTAVNNNSSILISDAQSDSRFREQESIIKLNLHSAMCVPLWNNKEIIGIIYADRISLLDQFTENDLKLLTLLANLAAVKIENAILIEQAIENERIEKELALASQIQKDFLPKEIPEWRRFDLAGKNIPCHEVGGDYYDFIPIGEDRMGIVIADVSGKGVSASLLMASLRAAMHSEIHPEYHIEKMASKLNTFVHSSTASNSFITFFYGELDHASNMLTFINAGHNPPFLLRKKGKVERLESCGFCLGMFPASQYPIQSLSLQPGDTLLLFSDGFTECRNDQKEEYGEKRLQQTFKKNSRLAASKLLHAIEEEVQTFTAGVEQMDDMTLVIVKNTKA